MGKQEVSDKDLQSSQEETALLHQDGSAGQVGTSGRNLGTDADRSIQLTTLTQLFSVVCKYNLRDRNGYFSVLELCVCMCIKSLKLSTVVAFGGRPEGLG